MSGAGDLARLAMPESTGNATLSEQLALLNRQFQWHRARRLEITTSLSAGHPIRAPDAGANEAKKTARNCVFTQLYNNQTI